MYVRALTAEQINNAVDFSGVFDAGRGEVIFSGESDSVAIPDGVTGLFFVGAAPAGAALPTVSGHVSITKDEQGSSMHSYGRIAENGTESISALGATILASNCYIKIIVRVG